MSKEVQERTAVVGALGEMLTQAARASVAKGASYEPQEKVNLNANDAWNAVAETIVKLVELKVQEAKDADG